MIKKEEAKECVGKGWSNLIDDFYNYLKENNYKVDVTEVKEKYAGLRISYDIQPMTYSDEEKVMDDNICDKINDLEGDSLLICEKCGEKSEIRIIKEWIKTLCEKCYEYAKNN